MNAFGIAKIEQGPQRSRNLGVRDLVQDVGIDEPGDLSQQVLRKLRDEDRPEPALAATLGDAGDLLEKCVHLLDALGAQKPRAQDMDRVRFSRLQLV